MALKITEMDEHAWKKLARKPELFVGVHESPWGWAMVGLVGKDLAALYLVERGKSVSAAVGQFVGHWPGSEAQCEKTATAAALKNAVAFWQNGKTGSLRVLLKGTDFQRRVWKSLLNVPRGETTTYGDLALRLKRPGASRAVGQAVGANPVGVLLPCHRVLGGGGKLGGYAWGPKKKKRLLQMERA
jgi:O-6-methylguanine DNA methyltransferase